MMMSLERIKTRLAAVPAPPWSEFCESGDWWIGQCDDEGSPIGDNICSSNPADMTQAVADFIVAAPADITALIAEVERLHRGCEQVIAACEACDEGYIEYSPPGLDAWLPTGDPNIQTEPCPYCGPARIALGEVMNV